MNCFFKNSGNSYAKFELPQRTSNAKLGSRGNAKRQKSLKDVLQNFDYVIGIMPVREIYHDTHGIRTITLFRTSYQIQTKQAQEPCRDPSIVKLNFVLTG